MTREDCVDEFVRAMARAMIQRLVAMSNGVEIADFPEVRSSLNAMLNHPADTGTAG